MAGRDFPGTSPVAGSVVFWWERLANGRRRSRAPLREGAEGRTARRKSSDRKEDNTLMYKELHESNVLIATCEGRVKHFRTTSK